MGPPAAGKSSIGRLSKDQVSRDLADTAQSMQYREEVNNDNLTDCMPGFPAEYKHVLSMRESKKDTKRLWKLAKTGVQAKILKKQDLATRLQWIQMLREDNLTAEAWALQWLTYLVYHHGPVRDSLALDIIKVTVVDARELPVYYSSCMAGKAMGRAMMILDLAHDKRRPVPHEALPFVGFWPFTSQEARFERQEGRAQNEKREKKLLGGNLDSNLVDMHYHAQQAETNITKLLGSLGKGHRATDDSAPESTDSDDGDRGDVIKVDHFLVIDNEGKEPKVLFDFASSQDDISTENQIRRGLAEAVEQVVSRSKLLDKRKWDSFDHYLFRVTYYCMKKCFDKEHPLRAKARTMKDVVKFKPGLTWPRDPGQVLPMITEIDEQVFFRKYAGRSTATDTNQYRKNEHMDKDVQAALEKLSDEDVDHLKTQLSVMRKFTCLAIMQHLKNEGDWADVLEEQVTHNLARSTST
jgi:hypothetical protein